MLKSKIPKVVSLILIVALIVPVLLAVPVSAEASVVMSGTCGTSVNYVLYDDGLLSITGIGAMKDYKTTSLPPWAKNGPDITRIVIGEGVTHVGNYAFHYYNSNYVYACTEISFPSTLTSIGNSAFYNFTNLASIDLPSNLQTIGSGAFSYSQNVLGSLVIPSTVTSIGSGAFNFCSASPIIFEGSTPPEMMSNCFNGTTTTSIIVPYGSLSAYQASTGLSTNVGFIYEAPPVTPTTPVLYTSFAGQLIHVDSGENVFLSIWMDNVNGDLSCKFYLNGVVDEDTFEFYAIEDGGGVVGTAALFTPGTDGIYEIYAVVTNTVGNQTETVTTDSCTIFVGDVSGGDDSGGSGSGGDIEISGRFDALDQEIDELQGSVDDLGNKVDGIQGTVNDMAENVENLPDDIQNGMQNVIDQEHDKTHSGGSEFVEQLEQLVPNDSEGFVTSMGSLVSSLSYDGTACVLPVPALTLPAIDGLFPSYTVMEAQEIDFEEFFHMMPENILLLVQSLCTIALIIYCFKELYDTIAYFFTLKKGDK